MLVSSSRFKFQPRSPSVFPEYRQHGVISHPMPELPEVEITRRGIAPPLTGQAITAVRVRDGRLRWPVPRRIGAILKGRVVRQVLRRAKYLLLDCGDGWLILHLGMSGSLRIIEPALPAGPHDHVDWVL